MAPASWRDVCRRRTQWTISGQWLLVSVFLGCVGVCLAQTCEPLGISKCYDERGAALRCIPEFVNAAFNIRVEATNTCGLRDSPTQYCYQTGATNAKKSCEYCDARNEKLSHGPEFLTDFNNNDNLTHWQSETMLEGVQYPNHVNLTLHLRKAFDITYVRLMFHSARPESFAIYKRTSEDGPWIPYQYYSATCRDTYGLPENSYVLPDDETRPLCTVEYSDISPLTGGNVAFSTLEGRPSANNFENSPVLQEWVTATDIRITLDRLNTFGDEVFGDPKVLKSYYYAISDFAVGGRCKCNGHASKCTRKDGRQLCCCEHHTDGPDCDKCLPFYNDRPWGRATGTDAHECLPCNCNGRSTRCEFDPKLYEATGHGGRCLNCTGNTDGPNCEQCRRNYYQSSEGSCISCNCNEIGSASAQCNNHGRCQCKPGVTGEKCDRCEANHYDFGAHGCRPCGCNAAGSLSNIPHCDPVHGICSCKEHVEGQRCDTCKLGFFNLDMDNEFGCTPCFCYGHSSRCRSAPGYSRVTVESSFTRDAEQWIARDRENHAVAMQYNALVQNIAVSAPSRESVYFIAPKQFLGDKRGSYNQHLSFSLRINQDGPRATVEDLVLEGVGLSIYLPIFGQGNQLPTTQIQEYKFRLHENQRFGWSPHLSAHDFMSVLSNLTAIKIRATYTPSGVGFLDNVRLESTQRAGSSQPAPWVEVCTCDDGYLGQFCESCNPGFRHDPPGNNPFARCVPCNCHGHADICDDTTGRCMCRHNTAGEFCERCARGYYGNALIGTSHDCKPCPCPNQGSCVDLGSDQVACLECPQGYGGHKCDVCTDGYYGDPLGRYGPSRPCQKCDCNSNVDANAIGNCNRTTGECLKCVHNTAGPHCERCLPGYHGDALAIPKGDCKPCNCDPYGSVRRGRGPVVCDAVTGQCECQSHVRGQRCDRCVDGFWHLETGTGCEPCNCDPVGSRNQTCDMRTGQCYCQDGVGGLRCDKCQNHHFAFSYDGCKDCECDPIGSVSLQCDLHSGQCQCRNNVEGRRCDRCKENKYDKQAGCVDCPPCYNLVQDAVNDHRGKLNELSELLESIDKNPQLVNDLDFEKKLREVMGRVDDLLRDALQAGGDDKNLLDQLEELHERLKAVEATSGKTAEKVGQAGMKSLEGVRNITEAEEIIRRAQEALKRAQRNVRDEGKAALDKARERSEKFGQQSERMSEIAREASQEADQQETDAVDIEAMAKRALNTSQEAFRIASEALSQQRETGDDIYNLKRELQDAQDLMERTKRLATDALNEATVAYGNALEVYTDAQGLLLPDADVTNMMQNAAEITEEAKKIQDEADRLMLNNKDPLDHLRIQMDEAEELLAKGEEQQQIADGLLAEVDSALDTAKQAVELGEKTLEEANKTLQTLKGFDRLVQQSQKKSNEALKRVAEIEALILEAEAKTGEAHDSLGVAQEDANDARDIALEAQRIAEQAAKEANGIRHEADETKERAGLLKDEADGLAREVAEAADRLRGLEEQAEEDRELAKDALERANEAKGNAQQSSRKVRDSLNLVNEILDVLSKVGDVDAGQLRDLEKKLAAAEKELEDADLDKRLGELRAARNLQNQWMRDYEEELEKLRRDVANVRAIRDALPKQCYRRIKLEPEP